MDQAPDQNIPGAAVLRPGRNGLPQIAITTPWSDAEIYLHGAHVTHFQRKGEPPLLFLSQASRFEPGQPIRGGVPVIFPWFGPREGWPAHGFARCEAWTVRELSRDAEGRVRARLGLSAAPAGTLLPQFDLEFTVTAGEDLQMELRTTNRSATVELPFEDCLHTYFEVGDARSIRIRGLEGVGYTDKVGGGDLAGSAEPITIGAEVDRVYQDTEATVVIDDPRFSRRIVVGKNGSRSTVVWNPWIEKSRRLPDFGDEEYHRMVCVESANVGRNAIRLAPGQSRVLQVRLATGPIQEYRAGE